MSEPKLSDLTGSFEDMLNTGNRKVSEMMTGRTRQETGDDSPPGPIEFFTQMVMEVMRTSATVMKKMPLIVVGLKAVLWALLAIAIMIVLMLVGLYLVQYFHPRMCLLSRSAAFEEYMQKMLIESEEAVFELAELLNSDPRPPLLHVGADDQEVLRKCGKDAPKCKTPQEGRHARTSCVFASVLDRLEPAVEKLTKPGREAFHQNLETFYKFHTTIRNLDRMVYSFFARKDVLNEPRFDGGGAPDFDAIEDFEKNFMEPFETLRECAERVTEITKSWCSLQNQDWYDEASFRFLTDMHLLDLAHNAYRDQTIFSNDTRKGFTFTLQFNVWTLYYVPYVEDIFVKRIPAIWIQTPQRFKDSFFAFGRVWVRAGDHISLLPCYLANRDRPEKRATECRTLAEKHLNEETQRMMERFQEGPAAPKTKRRAEDEDDGDEDGGDGEDEDDVVEPFGFLKVLTHVGTFFRTILDVARAMARALAAISRDPINAIMTPILLVVGVLLSMSLTFTYTMLTLVGVGYILGFVYAWIASFVVAIVLTLIEIAFALVLLVVFVLVWVLDLLTGGLIVKLMRCESLPDEWEHRPNYAEGNDAGRVFGTACCYPCAKRYKPVLGVVCARLNRYIPDFCPHQQIISAFRNGDTMGRFGPYMFDKYPAYPGFRMLKRQQKEQAILAALDDAKGFLGKCYDRLGKYDKFNRHVCFNIGKLPGHKYPESAKDKMRKLCYQVYCDYRMDKNVFRSPDVSFRSSDERDSDCLCHSLADDDNPIQHEAASPNVATATSHTLVRRSLFLLVALLVMLASVYALISSADSLAEDRVGESRWDLDFHFFSRRYDA